MGSWPQGISAVTLLVEDLEASKEFYRNVVDRPLTYADVAPARERQNPAVTPGHLQAAVARAVRAPVDRLDDVRREAIAYDAFLAGRSVARIRGLAQTPAGTVPWSVIEKATDGPAAASPYLYDNARREFRAYDSGLLDDLAPSVAAPTPCGLAEAPDGALTLFLENVAGSPVDEDALRVGLHAAIALRWTLVRDLVVAVEDGSSLFRGSAPGESREESIAQLTLLSRVLFDSAAQVSGSSR
jgi:hypothetical protein